jgi:hypothetical protein
MNAPVGPNPKTNPSLAYLAAYDDDDDDGDIIIRRVKQPPSRSATPGHVAMPQKQPAAGDAGAPKPPVGYAGRDGVYGEVVTHHPIPGTKRALDVINALTTPAVAKRIHRQFVGAVPADIPNDPCVIELRNIREALRGTRSVTNTDKLLMAKNNMRDNWITSRLPLWEVRVKGTSEWTTTTHKYMFMTFSNLTSFLREVKTRLRMEFSCIDIRVTLHESIESVIEVYDSIGYECLVQADDAKAAYKHMHDAFVPPNDTRLAYVTEILLAEMVDGVQAPFDTIKERVQQANSKLDTATSKY